MTIGFLENDDKFCHTGSFHFPSSTEFIILVFCSKHCSKNIISWI